MHSFAILIIIPWNSWRVSFSTATYFFNQDISYLNTERPPTIQTLWRKYQALTGTEGPGFAVVTFVELTGLDVYELPGIHRFWGMANVVRCWPELLQRAKSSELKLWDYWGILFFWILSGLSFSIFTVLWIITTKRDWRKCVLSSTG